MTCGVYEIINKAIGELTRVGEIYQPSAGVVKSLNE